ncbi:YppF family protein [Guptibacillus algicola]|uniref:YppF family protein n=1 Tax=Guptibacillus algicola TaxID=225844 RepID=UPI001CD550AF|nr:YppF family protein [Alkalihalobacillus algicola]MCA0988399.1 YppF family protein [Alkalihalobacillus algicola]
MSIKDLISTFEEVKGKQPASADELLDFAQANYLRGHISLHEYQCCFKELNAQGAKKPEYFSEKELKTT